MEDLLNYIDVNVKVWMRDFNKKSLSFKQIERLRLEFLSYIVLKENSIRTFLLVEHNECRVYKKVNKDFKIELKIYKSGNLKLEISKFRQINEKKGMLNKMFNFDVGYVYFLESEYGWKIGSTLNLADRINTFNVKLPFKFKFRYFIKVNNKRAMEKTLHNYFGNLNLNGEWFQIDDEKIILFCKENNLILITPNK